MAKRRPSRSKPARSATRRASRPKGSRTGRKAPSRRAPAKRAAKAKGALGASMPSGSIVHTEISSWDPAATRRFMTDVFGWDFRDVPGPMPYATASVAGTDIAGVRALMTQEPGPSSIPYLAVRNLTATLAAVEVQGGKILVPPTPVAKMGWFFWFQAPGGPVLSCWQADARAPVPKA